MFKFPNLIDDFKNLKFDSVSQALASSQTLISSFKSSTASIVAKAVNQDALIKGQTNGPDNFKIQIQDGIADLENMRDSYRVNLKTIRGLTVPAFVPSTEEAISIRANGDSGLTIYRGRIPILQCKLNLSPSQPSEFVREFRLCTLPPDIAFVPTITNTDTPTSLSVMHKSIQGNDVTAASNVYMTICNIPSYTNKLWMAMRPLALSNVRPGANRWRDGVITHDPIDIGNGKVAHLNICLVQGVEYVATGKSSYILMPSIGILFSATIANADDFDLSGDIVLKVESFYKRLVSLNGVNVTSNNSIEYSLIRDAVNGALSMNDSWNQYPVISELDRSAQLPSLRGTFRWNFGSIAIAMAEFISGVDSHAGTIWQVPTGTTVPVESDAVDEMTFDEVSIDTANVRTEDGYTLTDLTADITSIIGDLTPKMNAVIRDLDSAYYE